MRLQDLWILILVSIFLASLTACSSFRWTNGGYRASGSWSQAPLSDDDAGYDQALYDQCRDSDEELNCDDDAVLKSLQK